MYCFENLQGATKTNDCVLKNDKLFILFSENLREQRHMIKGVKRKIIDVANTLNLSTTVMRLIDRKTEGDKWILYGGMTITCIVMFLIISFFT